MKSSSKDQAEGAAHELKGLVKKTVGKVINDPDLETQGQAEEIIGKVQKKVGQVEKVLEQ